MDEYISREAVLKAFRITAKNSNKDYQRGLQDAIDCLVPEVIADIPSADVQPVKHGRWEQIGKQSAKCTACGGVLKSNGIDKTGKALIFNAVYHYCPYCGARLIGGEKLQ